MAISAIISRASAFSTALAPEGPHEKGPCPYTRTAVTWGIEISKSFDDYVARLPFVGVPYFLVCHWSRDRNLAIEVVSVGSSEARDRLASLGKRNRVAGMGVDNSAHACESLE